MLLQNLLSFLSYAAQSLTSEMGVPLSSLSGQSITIEGVQREHVSRKLLVSIQKMKKLSYSFLVFFNDKAPLEFTIFFVRLAYKKKKGSGSKLLT